jgi:hypothetical protein
MAINTVDVQKLGLVDPLGIELTNDYAPGNNSKNPRYRVSGNRLVIYLSNTLINQFFERGTEKEYCPKRVFEEYMVGNWKKEPSKAMNQGSYFETKCIGGGAGGSKVLTLPPGRGGKMSVVHKRIDEQVAKFKMLCDEYGITISDDFSNTQIKEKKLVEQSDWLDVVVFLTGEADIISPIESYKGHSFDMTVIDLKLTGDLTSTFGKYAWGNLHFINTQQGTIYHMLFDMPFFFWVFDHKPKGLENRLIPVNHNINHPNPELASKAKYRLASTREVIRKTTTEVAQNFIKGWPATPTPTLCTGCPVLDCKDRNLLEEI